MHDTYFAIDSVVIILNMDASNSQSTGLSCDWLLTVNEKEIKYVIAALGHKKDIISNTVCIFFDTETTGLSKGLTYPHRKDEIIQMSLVACTAQELEVVQRCWNSRFCGLLRLRKVL